MSEQKALHVKAFLINRAESIAHIAKYDPFGEILGSWCGRRGFDVQSNVSWGNPTCELCVMAATAPTEPQDQKDGTGLKVGELRKAMEGLPDDAQMFINIPGYGEDFAIKAAWQSLQIPEGVKDWRTAEQVVGLEIHLGTFEEVW